jgi:endonuclease YncB( thermonuclease family)
MKKILFPLAIILALLFSVSAFGKEPVRDIKATVVKIVDGDTVHALTPDRTKLKIRLYGIDAPEVQHGKKEGQSYGNEAKDTLTSLVLNKAVIVRVLDIDRYKRQVCIILLNGQDINRNMVDKGYAWAYRQYLGSAYASEYIDHYYYHAYLC